MPTSRPHRAARRLGLAVAVALVASAAAGTGFLASSGGRPPTPSAGRSSPRPVVRARRGQPAPATFPGPDGVEARWVVTENARPGTTAWEITGPQGAWGIDGYASAVQATVGQVVTLFVSTAAPSYQVTAYRMGWYGGAGARQVWQSPAEPGVVQPGCPVTAGTNMVECSWAPSLTVTVTGAWPQGDYLFKLVGSGGQQSYVPLTVWDPTSHATYLVQNDVLTWQAWNTYGGYDFYGGGPSGVTPTYADRALVVSFDRPYAPSFGDGTADFLGEEYPLVRFAEQHGLDVSYGTDITTDEDPGSLLDHRAFLSLGHDEQWSRQMRDAAVSALDHGVNLVFFGASAILRKVRLQPSPLGADREVVNYRDPQADPLYTTDPADVSQNQWSQPPADWDPSQLVGSDYLGYGVDAPLVDTDPTSWLYAGTGLTAGAQLPGVIASDVNGYVTGGPEPADTQILAHSPVTLAVGAGQAADTTYYSLPADLGGGGVFCTGTNGWIPAMSATPALDQMTGNLLALFGAGPAGLRQPSVANWQQYYG